MDNIQTLINQVEALSSELQGYALKPNKAKSKRIRMLLGDLKKSTPAYRAALVASDKAGY